ncbi:MAG: hypothetical protein JXB05_24150 [Myxococcaceae bacterium]|nr:hypothetical protein [Myxococcaceae bacterium]
MGSGKSTTLRYLTHHFLSHHAVVIYCDLDRLLTEPRDARSEKEGEAEAAGALAEALSTEMSRHNLLSCEDELQGIWSWALSDTLDPKKHPSIQVLAKARDWLKLRHGAQWRSEAKDVLKTRRELCEELRADPLGWLRYQHLLVDYYLTVKRGGDRSRLIIILDNADPLPPVRQRAFLSLAQRMASTANCKIIFALRPLTYNLANIQAASSVLSVVEQWGPEVIDVIANRMQQFLDASEEEILRRADLDESVFPLQFYEESVGQVSLSLEDVKHWVSETLACLRRPPARRHAGVASLGEPNAREFIEGASGHSLRAGLLLAQKLFGSSLPPIGTILRGEATQQRKRGVRDQDLIRAVLVAHRDCFQATPTRIIDNLFDSGRPGSRGNLTCKLRLLYRLRTANERGRSIDELEWYLEQFGFSRKTILSAMNLAISQYKRLAWCDSCAMIGDLEQEARACLALTQMGRFYLGYAMFNLEYVQEVHVDCSLPEEHVIEFDPQRFEERMRSVELFLRHLHDLDKAETLQMIHKGERARYIKVHGRTLFTLEMLTALERQVRRVATLMAEGGRAERRRHLMGLSEHWQAFLEEVRHGSRDVLQGLNGGDQ